MTNLVFLDTETTGLDPVENQILTIGVVVERDGVIAHRELIPVKYEGGPTSPGAMNANGIDLEAHNETALPVRTALTVLNKILHSAGFHRKVAHNASFDKEFLTHAYRKAGVQDTAYVIRSNWMCTAQLTLWADHLNIINTSGKANLDAALRAVGASDRGTDAHDALDDALLSRHVYHAVREVIERV